MDVGRYDTVAPLSSRTLKGNADDGPTLVVVMPGAEIVKSVRVTIKRE